MDSVPRRGRAAAINPPNRFERLHLERGAEDYDDDERRAVPTQFLRDASRTILAKNDSPDVPFTFSLNPFRGCEHGCPYCYARPSHEFLGFSAGLDFETRILVKENAPDLLADHFERKSWQPQVVALSGNTDPYQPVERRLGLTRRCLEVFLRYRNPVSIITKNHLVTRDLDLLAELARLRLVHVTLSVTSLDADLAGRMEPRASRPVRRLDAVAELAAAGVPVGVNVAPVVPGLTDEEMPAILRAAAERGALHASYLVMRLPGAVEPIFLDWLERHYPDRVERVTGRLRSLRGGALNDPRFGTRMRGEGPWAAVFSRLFRTQIRRLGLNRPFEPLETRHFRRPGGQGELF